MPDSGATRLPSTLTTRSDIHHRKFEVENSISDNQGWSGYVAAEKKLTFIAVDASWNVPEIFHAELNHNTFSSLWVGLDGYDLDDLVQAGTEQDALQEGSMYFPSYYAWTEVLAGEVAQPTGLSPNAGDRMSVEVWISTGSGAPNADGQYAAFRIVDETQSQSTGSIYVPLSAAYKGWTAEWIAERPCLSVSGEKCLQYAELSST